MFALFACKSCKWPTPAGTRAQGWLVNEKTRMPSLFLAEDRRILLLVSKSTLIEFLPLWCVVYEYLPVLLFLPANADITTSPNGIPSESWLCCSSWRKNRACYASRHPHTQHDQITEFLSLTNPFLSQHICHASFGGRFLFLSLWPLVHLLPSASFLCLILSASRARTL